MVNETIFPTSFYMYWADMEATATAEIITSKKAGFGSCKRKRNTMGEVECDSRTQLN